MKRVLCGALLGVAAFTAVPAHAAQGYGVQPIVWTGDGRVGVGANYTRDGGRTYDPVGGAWVNTNDPSACAGLSYQIPLCTDDILH